MSRHLHLDDGDADAEFPAGPVDYGCGGVERVKP